MPRNQFDASASRRIAYAIAILGFLCLQPDHTFARPPGPSVMCEVWPTIQSCESGQPECSTCHDMGAFNVRNSFGQAIEVNLPQPLDPNDFADALRTILPDLAESDADDDGYANLLELEAGTLPGNAASIPMARDCEVSTNPLWNVCGYDPAYVYKRVSLDVCGTAPNYDDFATFKTLSDAHQNDHIRDTLNACLDSAFWQGKDGVLWRMAHKKIRPLAAVKSGQNAGPVPLGDYDFDYALFAYTQIDDHDARDVLLGDYHVRYDSDAVRYEVINNDTQNPTSARRAGLITTEWFMVINTMFTPVPRTTAAQAYRSFLGLDIARSEGLIAPSGNQCANDSDCPAGVCLDGMCLTDYDEKGITDPACSYCHSTLDPLSFPFSRYHGIAGGGTAAYAPNRMNAFNPAVEGAGIRDVPESGFLFGQPVQDLIEWARVAANSEAFAQATVKDYWHLLVGHDPTPAERAEYDTVWRAFMEEHGYRVERMLHDLIRTEAYGVP